MAPSAAARGRRPRRAGPLAGEGDLEVGMPLEHLRQGIEQDPVSLCSISLATTVTSGPSAGMPIRARTSAASTSVSYLVSTPFGIIKAGLRGVDLAPHGARASSDTAMKPLATPTAGAVEEAVGLDLGTQQPGLARKLVGAQVESCVVHRPEDVPAHRSASAAERPRSRACAAGGSDHRCAVPMREPRQAAMQPSQLGDRARGGDERVATPGEHLDRHAELNGLRNAPLRSVTTTGRQP